MIVIGIDIGMTGAIAAVDSRGTCAIADLPIVEDELGKRVDGRGVILLLREFVPAGEAGLVVMENIRVRQMAGRKMSHATETSLVQARGAVQASADIARLQAKVVEPQTWKRFFGLSKDKGEAREIATRLYPAAEHQLRRVKDHNRAESLLIAHYGMKHFA